jgi:hypothetical protein
VRDLHLCHPSSMIAQAKNDETSECAEADLISDRRDS